MNLPKQFSTTTKNTPTTKLTEIWMHHPPCAASSSRAAGLAPWGTGWCHHPHWICLNLEKAREACSSLCLRAGSHCAPHRPCHPCFAGLFCKEPRKFWWWIYQPRALWKTHCNSCIKLRPFLSCDDPAWTSKVKAGSPCLTHVLRVEGVLLCSQRLFHLCLPHKNCVQLRTMRSLSAITS